MPRSDDTPEELRHATNIANAVMAARQFNSD